MSMLANRLGLGTCVLLALAACGSSSNGPHASGSATVTGMLNGGPFSPADAAALPYTYPNSGTPPEQQMQVVISNFAGVCGISSVPAHGAVLDLAVMMSGPVSTGTFPIDGLQVRATYYAQYQCVEGGVAPASMESATSGSITLTTLTPTVTGSYNVTFASGDTASGTFTAPVCAASNAFPSTC